MQSVSTFNRNIVIFLVSLALINLAIGFYKSFNKSKESNTTQINYKVKNLNVENNDSNGMSVDYISRANEMLEIFKNTIFQLIGF